MMMTTTKMAHYKHDDNDYDYCQREVNIVEIDHRILPLRFKKIIL